VHVQYVCIIYDVAVIMYMYMYTSAQAGYLLSLLESFFIEVEPEVESISGEESDTQSFMNLMNIFNKASIQFTCVYIYNHNV